MNHVRFLLLLIMEPNTSFFNFNLGTREMVSLSTLMWLLDELSDLLINILFSIILTTPLFLSCFQCYWPPTRTNEFFVLTYSDFSLVFNAINSYVFMSSDLLRIFNIIDLFIIDLIIVYFQIFYVIDLLKYLTYFQCH